MRMRTGTAFALACALAGCQTVGGYYDRLFGSSGPAVKPMELQSFKPSAEPKILWQAAIGSAGRYEFAPVLHAGAVYAASAGGDVVKLDAATGKTEWRVNAGARLSAGPGTDGKTLAVGTPRGEVIALDAGGKSLWKAHITGAVLSAPAIEEGVVAVRSDDGRIFGLAAPDGRRRWLYQRALPALTVRAPAGITAVPGGVFSGFAGGKLVAVLLKNGALAWEATIATPRGSTELERVTDIVGAPLVDGRAVCAVAFQGKAGCFDVLKGTQLWVRDLSGLMPLSGDGRSVYAIDDRDAVHALDRGTGASLWKQERLIGRRLSAAVPVAGAVAVGDYQGYVHFLDRSDGAFVARIATDGSPVLHAPVATERGVIVQTRNGGLFHIAIR